MTGWIEHMILKFKICTYALLKYFLAALILEKLGVECCGPTVPTILLCPRELWLQIVTFSLHFCTLYTCTQVRGQNCSFVSGKLRECEVGNIGVYCIYRNNVMASLMIYWFIFLVSFVFLLSCLCPSLPILPMWCWIAPTLHYHHTAHVIMVNYHHIHQAIYRKGGAWTWQK